MGTADLGIVVIGRNEGERLVRCLASVRGHGSVVYVDSGSQDGSVERAREAGASVVCLDLSRPFSAARARNEGFTALLAADPGVRYVQFVDGDCEVRGGWLGRGAAELEREAGVSVVCGRLRERHPERSIYNRMCDLSWDYPLGEIDGCGGVAMYRAAELAAVGGFNQRLIVGEEFELCSRLRARGGRVVRLDEEMAWHDVNITRFSQWWRRTTRAGFSAAEAWRLYPPAVGAPLRRRVVRAVTWGAVHPLGFVGCSIGGLYSRASLAAAGLLAALWLLNLARLFWRERARRGARTAGWLAWFSMVGKLAEFRGVVEFLARRGLGRADTLIDYRS